MSIAVCRLTLASQTSPLGAVPSSCAQPANQTKTVSAFTQTLPEAGATLPPTFVVDERFPPILRKSLSFDSLFDATSSYGQHLQSPTEWSISPNSSYDASLHHAPFRANLSPLNKRQHSSRLQAGDENDDADLYCRFDHLPSANPPINH